MKKILTCILLFMGLALSACGYQVQGLSPASTNSILGNGDKTIAIAKIEDPSLYPWVSYYVTNQFHTEMNFRKLAKWADKDKADFIIEITMPRFEQRSSINDETDKTLLSTIVIEMIVTVRNTKTNEVWTSGTLRASEYFDSTIEEQSVKENLNELIYSACNAMQNNF